MQLEDWLDDLCVRFIINLPPEELASVERICFQVEEAQWFYEDFIRPLDPALPSLNLKQFSLRIFQHCPLFSQWSAQHHTTAFAEFLAYKQRVPVRGAILLNHDMDEVVLVKGWKKGANWSFPRGKINKDENDLDCAVREVYEETGFDARAAGLVKAEKDMKYIEVTMREQHMRLYVFRDVPRDTHFEPRTRKEISKIEWYKLSDLPTQKKKPHHDANEESLAINANKFYMVAPFLHPLKKWIVQQKKRGNRRSSNLAGPPVYAEEYSEAEVLPSDVVPYGLSNSPNVLSSLPEVAAFQEQPPLQDPTAHLKHLLKIGGSPPDMQQINDSTKIAAVDTTRKSDALLALLRNGSSSQTETDTQEPPYQEPAPPLAANNQFPGSAMFAPRYSSPDVQPLHPNKQNLLSLFSKSTAPAASGPASSTDNSMQPGQIANSQPAPPAPYQRTGDPQFARHSPEVWRNGVVPPADSLPKLTHHTRALLDAFKGGPPTQINNTNPSSTPPSQTPAIKQTLLDMFKKPNLTVGDSSIQNVLGSQKAAELSNLSPSIDKSSESQVSNPEKSVNLLDLFKRASHSPAVGAATVSSLGQSVPVELAAVSMRTPEPQQALTQNEKLSALFKKDKVEQPKKRRTSTSKAGQTGATIDTPLAQPQFEGVTPIAATKPMQRSPLSTHRTLFDPKQPTPVKILPRPDSRQNQTPRSPRPPKAHSTPASPKRNKTMKEKPFQPQILRRPQASEAPVVSAATGTAIPADPGTLDESKVPATSTILMPSPVPNPSQDRVTSPIEISEPRRILQRPDNHKQSLLSLFGSSAAGATRSAALSTTSINTILPRRDSPGTMSNATFPNSPSGFVSPLSASQISSPIDTSTNTAEHMLPISTRSRMGSLNSVQSASLTNSVASLGGGGNAATPQQQQGHAVGQSYGGPDGRPKVEKKQTNKEDKAFLLGYLGRIASRDA